jgi:hypothetical protein
MSRLEAMEEVEKWYKSLSTIIPEEEIYDLYEAYCEKLEAIDNQCEGYTNFEDVPDLHF